MKNMEINHHSHPHPLKAETEESPFICGGCQERGWGLRYRCADCNYDLHNDCAFSTAYTTHLFYPNCTFSFRTRGPAGTICKACARPALGFVYVSGTRSLHPCCSNLQKSIQSLVIDPSLGKKIDLFLEKRTWLSSCGICHTKGLRGKKGWSYRSADRQYHFHICCIKQQLSTTWGKDHEYGNMDIATTIRELNMVIGLHKNTVAIVVNLLFSVVLGDLRLEFKFFAHE